MKRWRYTQAGLEVDSELALPEWAVFERPAHSGAVDVSIALNDPLPLPPPDPATPAPRGWGSGAVTADTYRFAVPGVGWYGVFHGREIVITPATGAVAGEVRLYLLGSAWGALCYQRGFLPLHASVVQVGEGALAFCGPAGSGKSSVAAWLTAQGCPLVSDDLCRCDVTGPRVHVYPSAPRLKLWRDTLQVLGRNEAGLDRDRLRETKFHVTDVPNAAVAPVPLRGVCLLEWGPPSLVRLRGLKALHRLVAAATYRGELLEPMGRAARHWQCCAELVRRVPVWVFSRPRDWSAMGAATDRLDDLDNAGIAR